MSAAKLKREQWVRGSCSGANTCGLLILKIEKTLLLLVPQAHCWPLAPWRQTDECGCYILNGLLQQKQETRITLRFNLTWRLDDNTSTSSLLSILSQEWKNIPVCRMWGGIITLIVIKNILWRLFWQTRIFLNELSWALDKARRQSILKSTVSLSLLLSSFKTSCQCCAAPSSSTLPPSTLTWFLVYLHPYSDSFLFFLQCTLWKVSAPLLAVFIKLT